ncbi:hypothetical protein OGAPHI_006848 [Ogataea philodendri]|uniref:Major facilitator superfamily (MFS) profile domain-containing protein n=1 Tax=Ogataea philodendri TaxID=1378263 RepID=A0A9P8T0H1_9ASCO|nr:uncharacterized protein OGAPHI_006848 [Ogataea philodendri]KAH3661441.1 hypothetical protein OGAPHI_006848 [Ogataea philodendri]
MSIESGDAKTKEVVELTEERAHDIEGSVPSAGDEKYPVTPSERVRLLRKIDLYVLPPISILFFLAYLDRSNIGNAKLYNLLADLNMTSEEYLVCLSVFFVGYCAFEIPSNIMLKLLSPKVWLPTIMIVWGLVSTLMALSSSYGGLLTARFLLGATEAGVFPGAIFYLSMWYGRRALVTRLTLFNSSISIAGAFGGLLAWAIGKMDGIGHKSGWFWIFTLEGIATILVALSGYFFVRRFPREDKFLSEREKSTLETILREDNDSFRDEKFSWSEVRKAFNDYKCWLYMISWMGIALPEYSLTLFLPTIIKNLGYTAAKAQLLTVPPNAVAFFCAVGGALLSQKISRRAPIIIFALSIASMGYIILLTDATVCVQYLGTFFATCGMMTASALQFTWVATNVSGQTKRAVATAIQISFGDIGAVIGCQMYRPNQVPRYWLGHGMSLGFLVISIVASTLLWFLLNRENARRDVITDGPPKDQSFISEPDFQGDDDVRWRFIV